MPDEKPVALVTGAGSGIGRTTCQLLSSKGYRIALAGRRVENLKETGGSLGTEGVDWVAMPSDLSTTDDAWKLPARVVDAFGQLDCVVNNAGWTPMKPIVDHTADDVAAIFGVNAIGPTLIIIEALRIMIAQGTGRIVNVSSMASGDPFPGISVYGGAKASLNTLTKGISNELGPDSLIKAFSVAPGAVETDLLRSIISADDLPTESCLTTDDVATEIVACATGERDTQSGETIWLPSS